MQRNFVAQTNCAADTDNTPLAQRQRLRDNDRSFASMVYFAGIVFTTIGYGSSVVIRPFRNTYPGDIVPTTDPSRAFLIVYACIGIPIFGYALSTLGQKCALVIMYVHRIIRRYFARLRAYIRQKCNCNR